MTVTLQDRSEELIQPALDRAKVFSSGGSKTLPPRPPRSLA